MTLCGPQRFLRLHDVLAQKADGLFNFAAATQFEQLVVLAQGIRSLPVARDTRALVKRLT